MSLIDPFGRKIEYIRLSVTDRCDLRCTYCLPKGYKDFGDPDEWLSFDEIERVISAFSDLGVAKVRITGGEPLLRKNLPVLAKQLSAIPGIDDLSLSTNAVKLAKSASALWEAGVSRINVGLDSLDPDCYRAISGGLLHKALDGICAAKEAGFDPIKINMVLMKGINDAHVDEMVDYCIENGFTLRLIETMPMGSTGRGANEQYIDLQTVRQRLQGRYDLVPGLTHGAGPARYYNVAGTSAQIGFITPISQHFCESCNRVRLSAEGTIYLCLGQNDKVELRPLLRQGVSDDGLREAIIDAIARKPERHEFREKPDQVVRFMSMTGG